MQEKLEGTTAARASTQRDARCVARDMTGAYRRMGSCIEHAHKKVKVMESTGNNSMQHIYDMAPRVTTEQPLVAFSCQTIHSRHRPRALSVVDSGR